MKNLQTLAKINTFPYQFFFVIAKPYEIEISLPTQTLLSKQIYSKNMFKKAFNHNKYGAESFASRSIITRFRFMPQGQFVNHDKLQNKTGTKFQGVHIFAVTRHSIWDDDVALRTKINLTFCTPFQGDSIRHYIA